MNPVIISVLDQVSRSCLVLGLKGKVEAKAEVIIKDAFAKGMVSKCEPIVIAAAAIFLARILVKDTDTYIAIASRLGVTEQTMFDCLEDICNHLSWEVLL